MDIARVYTLDIAVVSDSGIIIFVPHSTFTIFSVCLYTVGDLRSSVMLPIGLLHRTVSCTYAAVAVNYIVLNVLHFTYVSKY